MIRSWNQKFASVEIVNWLCNVEDTFKRNNRLLDSLIYNIKQINDYNELAYQLIQEQDTITKNRKSKLLNTNTINTINMNGNITKINSKNLIKNRKIQRQHMDTEISS